METDTEIMAEVPAAPAAVDVGDGDSAPTPEQIGCSERSIALGRRASGLSSTSAPPPPPPNKRRSTSSSPAIRSEAERGEARRQNPKSEAESPDRETPFVLSFQPEGRQVESVGCADRSFSGDSWTDLDRIRPGTSEESISPRIQQQDGVSSQQLRSRQRAGIKERVKCGGIFGGFGMISSRLRLLALSRPLAAGSAPPATTI
ncbi:uncharacterized protein A4U43_C09F15940 [Asparagus officinalis]|uniref:Uncharacterized protein n=1 Tax=Asparagus officinalis TaxID=4686 RepID=A0A5P1EB77_ASPOF|nr:uncharacterized protein A4U43_C09F15940 [Asparagus officinalis]